MWSGFAIGGAAAIDQAEDVAPEHASLYRAARMRTRAFLLFDTFNRKRASVAFPCWHNRTTAEAQPSGADRPETAVLSPGLVIRGMQLPKRGSSGSKRDLCLAIM